MLKKDGRKLPTFAKSDDCENGNGKIMTRWEKKDRSIADERPKASKRLGY